MKTHPNFIAIVILAAASTAFAGSATWNLNPTSEDWNTPANWTPATVPNGEDDAATFDVSHMTQLSLSASTIVDRLVFNPNASEYTITVMPTFPLTLDGFGIKNDSAFAQHFVVPANSAIFFDHQASAGNSTFIIYSQGVVSFNIRSSAGTASFTLNEALTNVTFHSDSTADNATFTINVGDLYFDDRSSAGNATLIANGPDFIGGRIKFFEAADGGTAQVKVFDTGTLDITYSTRPAGMTIGSLEGNGLVVLSSQATTNLVVGSNNRSTTFSGLISGGRGGLSKIGTGRLILSNANTYTGSTVVSEGKLAVTNRTGSATGTGSVTVNGGTLGGRGVIAGAVTIGTGSGTGAALAPALGGHKQNTLTMNGSVTLLADATYTATFRFNDANQRADRLIADGVAINGAMFELQGPTQGALPVGTIFTVIDNTAATAIAGTFSNLPDGGTITVGNDTFQANYEGGDGNDLTLTVISP